MYSPTTSPYGYSSFPKEESLVTFDTPTLFFELSLTFFLNARLSRDKVSSMRWDLPLLCLSHTLT